MFASVCVCRSVCVRYACVCAQTCVFVFVCVCVCVCVCVVVNLRAFTCRHVCICVNVCVHYMCFNWVCFPVVIPEMHKAQGIGFMDFLSFSLSGGRCQPCLSIVLREI